MLLAEKPVSQSILYWTDVDGDTLVHIAARVGHFEAVNELVKMQVCRINSDTVLRKGNKQNKTPKDVAKSPLLKETLDSLLSMVGKYHGLSEQKPTCLIFYSSDKRPSAEYEVKYLKRFCDCFGITPIIPRSNEHPTGDLTKDEMCDALIDVAAGGELSCLLVAIMCHGDSGSIESRGEIFAISELVMSMDYPSMVGKPKVSEQKLEEQEHGISYFINLYVLLINAFK